MPNLIEDAPTVLIPPDALGEPFAPGGRELGYHGAIFGTDWSLKVLRRAASDPASDAAFLARVLRTCHQVLELIDSQMSLWRCDSDIARFNRLPVGKSLVLPEPFSIVVEKAFDISRETGGAFWPGLYEAVEKWGFGASQQDDPVAAGLAHAHAHALTRDGARVAALPEMAGGELKKHAGFALDLNGIAKGYAIDLLCDVVRSHPETVSCLVEIGGELKGFGTRADGMPFWTDIAADGDPDTASHRVALYGWACATSGVAERFHERAGSRFSHILDPATLSCARTDLAAATVFDKDCARADALATALMVMGSKQGLAFADANGISCILTPENRGRAVLSAAMREWSEMSEPAILGIEGGRWLLAAAIALGWIAGCAYWLRGKAANPQAGADTLIAHASQTGTAERFASLMKAELDEQGGGAALLALGDMTMEQLRVARRLVIFAATTGAGEAPDPARRFERQLAAEDVSLPGLKVFILGLGDRSYADFCAFGFRLKAWAEGVGAQVVLVPVDNQSPADLATWNDLMRANDLPPISRARAVEGREWAIELRDQVAQGDRKPIERSRSGPLFHVSLAPVDGTTPDHSLGDLFEWHGADGIRRDFSIASLPGDHALDLYVRRVELPDGSLGKASSILTSTDGPERITGQIRRFANFHETAGEGPLLAIAAGSGWGGIRPHVLAAIRKKRPAWLVYGEREPDPDSALFAEMRGWRERGMIERLDLAFSRGAGEGVAYVQDVVSQGREEIAAFLGPEGAVVTCGATAMGEAVEKTLEKTLGSQWVEDARSSQRWRVALY